MAEIIYCRCGSQWTGAGRAHCTAKNCHQTFGGVTSFDAHRKQYGEHGSCIDPATLGLVQTEKGIWSVPQQED